MKYDTILAAVQDNILAFLLGVGSNPAKVHLDFFQTPIKGLAVTIVYMRPLLQPSRCPKL